MSRYFLQKEVPAGTACIAYGFDHALGYFYQEEQPGQKELVVDICSHFDGLTGVQLAERLVGGEEALIAIIGLKQTLLSPAASFLSLTCSGNH